MSKRYPFPLPFGWFQVAYSSDLEPGQSKPLSYFGQELVIFRTEAGVPKVLDAYCPHLGAHLGYGTNENGGGGRVEAQVSRVEGRNCSGLSTLIGGARFASAQPPWTRNLRPSQCLPSRVHPC